MTALSFAEKYADIRRRLYGDIPRRIAVKPVTIAHAEPENRRTRRLKDVPRYDGPLSNAGGHAWRSIINEVAFAHDVSVREILRDNRHREAVMPRWECAYRMRMEIDIAGLPASWTQIARWIGGRDHTTPMHGARRWAEINGLELPR